MPKVPARKKSKPRAKIDSTGWIDLEDSENDNKRQELSQRLRQRIQEENVVCLVGSGVSLGVGGPSMNKLWHLASDVSGFEHALKSAGHSIDHEDIEVFLSRCRMAKQLHGTDSELDKFVSGVQKAITAACRDFLKSTTRLSRHCDFLQRLARRPTEKPRVTLFTTNYDLCIEQAAGQAGLPVIDGFTHTFPQRFDGRNYDMDLVRRGIASCGTRAVAGDVGS